VAFERLSEADREGALSGADLELLAEASWFTAHADRETEYNAGDPAAETATKATLRGLTTPVRLAALGWD
jgi:hypothetical protein